MGAQLREPRSLHETLADLRAKMKTMPLTDARRGALARQIVGLEDEIEARQSRVQP